VIRKYKEAPIRKYPLEQDLDLYLLRQLKEKKIENGRMPHISIE
jgi:hypothetical protein